jgi:hypothetical protein
VAAAWMTESGKFMQLVTGFICGKSGRYARDVGHPVSLSKWKSVNFTL